MSTVPVPYLYKETYIRPFMRRYFRDERNHKVGVIHAYKRFGDKVYIGFSFCDTRYDKFNIDISEDLVSKRIDWFEHASLETVMKLVPYQQVNDFTKYVNRVLAYFRDVPSENFPRWVQTLIKMKG